MLCRPCRLCFNISSHKKERKNFTHYSILVSITSPVRRIRLHRMATTSTLWVNHVIEAARLHHASRRFELPFPLAFNRYHRNTSFSWDLLSKSFRNVLLVTGGFGLDLLKRRENHVARELRIGSWQFTVCSSVLSLSLSSKGTLGQMKRSFVLGNKLQ